MLVARAGMPGRKRERHSGECQLKRARARRAPDRDLHCPLTIRKRMAAQLRMEANCCGWRRCRWNGARSGGGGRWLDGSSRCHGLGNQHRQTRQDPLGHADWWPCARQPLAAQSDCASTAANLLVTLEPLPDVRRRLIQARNGKTVLVLPRPTPNVWGLRRLGP